MSDPKRPDDRSDPLDLRLEPVAAPPAEHPSRPAAAPPVKERDPFEQLRQETFGPPPEVQVVSPEDPAPEATRAAEPAREGTPTTPAPVAPTPTPAAAPTAAGDVATRRLIAGVLAIVFGWLGAHKFYLGMTRPGLTVAGVLVLGWVVTGVLTFLTAGGLLLGPLMSLLFSALVILGIVEGVIYLSRSDADFERTYLRGKKPWL